MDEQFFEAHVHRGPHVVLGRRLHPLCLHDILKLMLVDSPYTRETADGKIKVDRGDLYVATAICAAPIDDFSDTFETRKLFPVLRNWIWERRTRKLSFFVESEKFDNFFRDYYAMPPTLCESSDSPIGAPWPLAVAAFLLQKTAMTRKEVWTMPVGEAAWLQAAIAEQTSSGVEILSGEKLEAMYHLGLRKRPNPGAK